VNEIEQKRREKLGLYDKQKISQLFLSHLDEIEEFVVICKYKNGDIGTYSSTSDLVTAFGLLEIGKYHAVEYNS